MAKALDLTGKTFGRLLVTSFSGREINSRGVSERFWNCLCECGKTTKVRTGGLTSGNTRSCGCLALDSRTKHGMSDSRIYHIWEDMKHRCDNRNNKQFDDYGGRGITYAEDWIKFEGFLRDMGQGYEDNLTLDRIDPNGNYCKENCRWATYKEQGRNRAISKTNKSGVMGVSLRLDSKSKEPYYVAQINFNGRSKSKWFSVKKYGEQRAMDLAIEERRSMLEMAAEMGEPFGENHGITKEYIHD